MVCSSSCPGIDIHLSKGQRNRFRIGDTAQKINLVGKIAAGNTSQGRGGMGRGSCSRKLALAGQGGGGYRAEKEGW
eukprot:259983-Pelagomonas_calceolata.AAC.2